MKKIFYLLLGLWTLVSSVAAQAPEAFHYQAVIRNKAGDLLKAQPVDVQISILEDSPMGVTVYQETHATKTSDAATISLQVGKGTPLQGVFSEINWASGKDYFIHTVFTLNGETVDLGATQLLSVPYALYAQHSGEKHDLVLDGQTLSIKGGGASVTLPASIAGGGDGGSCLWTRENIATATYPGSMALKSFDGSQYLKAYSDTDAAGHLRLNVGGENSILFDPGLIQMIGNNSTGTNIWLWADNVSSFAGVSDQKGHSTLFSDGLAFYRGEIPVAGIGKNTELGYGYLELNNNQGKENIRLSTTIGSSGSTGFMATCDPEGNDLVRITTLKVNDESYQSNASIGLYYHGDLRGQFYVDVDGRSVLRTDLLYVDGYQLYSATLNYTETSTRAASFSPCYVSESAGQITFRGTATLANGSFRIVLPPEEAKKIAEGSVTIQLTPLSTSSKGLAVVQKENDAFTVAELQSGKGSYAFDWTLTALCKEEAQLRSGQVVESAGAAKEEIQTRIK